MFIGKPENGSNAADSGSVRTVNNSQKYVDHCDSEKVLTQLDGFTFDDRKALVEIVLFPENVTV